MGVTVCFFRQKKVAILLGYCKDLLTTTFARCWRQSDTWLSLLNSVSWGVIAGTVSYTMLRWLMLLSKLSYQLYCCCSVAKSSLTLYDHIVHSTPGFPVLHYFPEFAQTHFHWISDVIKLCHPLLSPSYPALNISQRQGLFQWVSSLHRWPKSWRFSFTISSSNKY